MADPPRQSDEAGDLALTWEDILFLEENCIGLRHVSTEAEMVQNAAHGFTGDALALCNIRALVPEEMIPAEWLERARGFGGRSVISLADYAHTLDQEQRHEIRGRVLGALMAFVRASLAFGAPWRGESTIRDALLLLSGTHSYLLLSLPFVAADDLDLYYGLGKVGRSRIPAGDVLCTVTASDILRHLAFTEGELHARLDEVYQDFRERIVKTIFVLLTRRIRQLRVRQSTT